MRICGGTGVMYSPSVGLEEGPPVTEMLLKRVRLVLGKDEDSPEASVEAIAQREVDNAILAAKGYGRFCAFRRERVEP